MHDANAFHRPALTAAEARDLVTKITDIVIERDHLREEVEWLRSILSELAAIRDLVGCDASGAVVARAMSNGHFGAAVRSADTGSAASLHGVADEADAAISPTGDTMIPEADIAEFSVHTTGCEPGTLATDDTVSSKGQIDDAITDLETEADDRHDVMGVRNTHNEKLPVDDCHDELPSAAVDFDGAGAESGVLPPGRGHNDRHDEPDTVEACSSQTERPVADDREGGQASAGIGIDTITRPPAGSLMLRILEHIENSGRPKRPWQLQRELMLSRAPSAELSRLVSAGFLERLQEGVYGLVGRRYDRSVFDGY